MRSFFISGCLLFIALLCINFKAMAQLPVELFAGHQRSTVDIMFFRFIKKKEGKNSRFLFFNRNRCSVDYKMTPDANLPQFGFTEALSYNHEKLGGWSPVGVVTLLNRGVFPKAGVQYARVKTDFTIFGWVVMETLRRPGIDCFFLARYTPPLTSRLHLFSQVELLNVLPTVQENNYTFTQRFRLGLKRNELQFGAGLDVVHLGRKEFTSTENFGGFLRYEF